MTADTVDTKPLRRDAAENRERLLDAANQVFSSAGIHGTVEEVARVAGVGMGTLYRRFPTKQALIDELVGGLRRDLLALGRSAKERTDGTGLESLLVGAAALQASDRGCVSQLWNHSEIGLDAMQEFRRVIAELLADAQAAGRIRADLTATDISLALWSVRGVISTTRAVAPHAWRRHLELLIAGMRPAGTHEPLREKALTAAQAASVTKAIRPPD